MPLSLPDKWNSTGNRPREDGSRAGSDALADRCEAGIAERGWGARAVELLQDQRFLGFVGLNPVGADLPFAPAVEVAWPLAYSAWGRGYATEAAQCALDFGFGELGLPEIVSFTTVNNRRSVAVMQRLGMQPAGTFGHPRLPTAHILHEHLLYRRHR